MNIEPRKNGNRILDVKIEKFHVSHADALSVREAIISCPEVKKWLSDNHLVEQTVISTDILASEKDHGLPKLSLSLRDASLRVIMNRIIHSPGFRNWIVSRWGQNNEYMSIWIS